MTIIYMDFATYQLADQCASIDETDGNGLLYSDKEQLKSAGFHQHYRSSPNQTGLEMAQTCVSKMLEKSSIQGITASDIDGLIYATCLPINANVGDLSKWKESGDIKHHIEYPGSHLQANLKLENAIVVGIDQQACTSMLGGIRLAKMFLQTEEHMQNMICLTSDRFPENSHYEQSYNLISDAAASVIVTKQKRGFKILGCHQITNGAMAQASDDETVGQYFNYSSRLIKELLEKCQLSITDLAYVVPQNTNKVAWQILSSVLGFKIENVLMETLEKVGHCISADNIVNLCELDKKEQFKTGDKILMLMAGFGLNWQAIVIEKV